MQKGCMSRFFSALFFTIILCSSLLGQDKQFEEDWRNGANSPGSTLTLKETGRSRANGNTIVSYRLFASGLPKGQLTLWTWNVGSKLQPVADAFLNPEGLIVSRLGDLTRKISEDPIDLRVFAGRGERKRFALTSDDWALQAFATAVPFPIEQFSDGCELAIEMSAPNYAGVVLKGSGFQPNEQLTVELASGPEGGQNLATATPTGTFTAAFLPSVKGQQSGMASVTLTSPKCSVAVQFPWGDGSYKIQ
jgi:hypothetical protein